MEYQLFLIGCIFYPTANVCVKKILSKLFASKLTYADSYLIAEKCVSSLQAVISTSVGLIIATSCQGNIMSDRHWLTNAYCVFTIPYFAYDTIAMYQTHVSLRHDVLEGKPVMYRWKHYARRNIPMLIHHILLPLVFAPCIMFFRGRLGDYFVSVFYTFEIVIPFISVRFILAQLNMKHTPAYVISGLLMIAVFFASRICVFPFLYWKYAKYSGIPFLTVPLRIPIHCNAGCLLILVIQVYFFALMIRGAIRYFYKAYTNKLKLT